MKKVLCLLLIIVTITGCSIKKFDDSSYDSIINQVLESNVNLNNVTLEGYKYYLPKDMKIYDKNDTNQILLYNNSKVYLYVDIISYYHEKNNSFEEIDNSFYSKAINYKDKFGYLQITEKDDNYFVEMMYNYAKIEAYVEKNKINDIIYDSIVVLSSIEYNDSILESLIGTNSLNYSAEAYNIFEPKVDTNSYLNWIDTYEDYNGEINIDEDSIELNQTDE